MTASTRSLKELFLTALEMAPAYRAVWLERECAADAGMREQLGLMLAAHDAPQSLLDRPGVTAATDIGPTMDQFLRETPGAQIGPYKLIEPIGEGGNGHGVDGPADRAGQAFGRAETHQGQHGPTW